MKTSSSLLKEGVSRTKPSVHMRSPVGCAFLKLHWVRNFFHKIRFQMEHTYTRIVDAISFDGRKLLCRQGKGVSSAHKQLVITEVCHPLVELQALVRRPNWFVDFSRWRVASWVQNHKQQPAVAGNQVDPTHVVKPVIAVAVTPAELVPYEASMEDGSTLRRRISSSVEITYNNGLLDVDVVCLPFKEGNGVNLACPALIHHGPGGISRAPEQGLLPSSDSNPVRRCQRIVGEEDSGDGTQTREGDLGAGERLPQHEPRWGSIVVHQG